MRVSVLLPLIVAAGGTALQAQQAFTWQQVQERFRANNPGLLAGQLNIEESKANEITAGLRPNPVFSLTVDQFQFFPSGGDPFRPIANAQFIPTISQLWERRNKRQLRVESARLTTSGATSDQADLERNLIFSLRDAFNRTLQAKALLELAEENIKYYDKVIAVNRDRLQVGDISKVDFQRVELQRVQFESDLASARVNLRTAKIQLLALLNQPTPVDQFDVNGSFDFTESILLLPELRQMAVNSRPDLRSAETAIRRAEADNRLAWANGSWDPTIGGEYLWNSSVSNTLGVNMNVPLRIFDKNQGEKQRTEIEIRRTQRLRDNALLNAQRDVDSAFETVQSVVVLLRPYREKYLKESEEVRDLISFSYAHGGSSLVDFLDAQKSYRDTQLAYRNLIGNYLTALAQLNLAVGQEVIPWK